MSLAQNNRTTREYSMGEKFQAGLELFGHEVKSIKTGLANLSSSRVIVRGGEVYIIGLKLQPYQIKNTPKTFEQDRTVKLLLRKKEVIQLYKIEEDKKVQLIPTHLYLKNNLVKIEIAACKKLNKHDKREKIKIRDLDRVDNSL